jgi:Ca2+-binding EF-hand superfamily protein
MKNRENSPSNPMSFHWFSIPVVLLLLLGRAAAGDDHADLFARLDTNADGQLTQSEIPASESSLFQRLVRHADANRDGQLTPAEFDEGLTPQRPPKPLLEKASNELPGSDALLLMLALMDRNADLVIQAGEAPANLRPLYEEFVELMNFKDRRRLRVALLRQQAIRYTGMANRFVSREGIDVGVELALLTDKQWAYVERLRTSLRPGEGLANPESASMLFGELDTDGDGKVTGDEVPEPFADRFAGMLQRADRNQDKQLSEQEFQGFSERVATLQTNRPPLAETNQRVNQLLEQADTNGDGQLTRREAPRRIANRFEKIDRNVDGFLDRQELSRAVEILAMLRNSAGFQPASTARSSERIKKDGVNGEN